MSKPITPEMVAKSRSETAHQRAFFCWASLPETKNVYPELKWMHSIPNSGARSNAIAAGQLVAEGLKSGVPDIFLPVANDFEFFPIRKYSIDNRWHGLYIEMKREDGTPSDFSDKQIEFANDKLADGYLWLPAYGWKQARACVELYLWRGFVLATEHPHRDMHRLAAIAWEKTFAKILY